jgi:hypothetical protein
MALKFDLVEFRERQARERRDRALAVIAELGGEKREPLLVPEDDPCNSELVMRLADCFCATRSNASVKLWSSYKRASRSR